MTKDTVAPVHGKWGQLRNGMLTEQIEALVGRGKTVEGCYMAIAYASAERVWWFADGRSSYQDIASDLVRLFDTDPATWPDEIDRLKAENALLREALSAAVALYGQEGGPWNISTAPGSWISRARAALGNSYPQPSGSTDL